MNLVFPLSSHILYLNDIFCLTRWFLLLLNLLIPKLLRLLNLKPLPGQHLTFLLLNDSTVPFYFNICSHPYQITDVSESFLKYSLDNNTVPFATQDKAINWGCIS